VAENFFRNLKRFRRIATRCDKTDEGFAAMIHLASTVLALR
jgi:transposase